MQEISTRSPLKTSASPASGAKLLSATLACLPAIALGGLAAHAADLSLKDERPAIMAPTYGWAGFYIGAHAGGFLDFDNDLAPVTAGGGAGDGGGGGAAGDASTGGDGGAGGAANLVTSDGDRGDNLLGLHIGYNWQNANLVYGVEADIDANNRIDNLLGSLRGRLGYATDGALFYLTAGLAYLHVDGGASSVFVGGDGGDGGIGGSISGGIPGAPGPAAAPGIGVASVSRGSGSEWGWVAGGGVEYMLSPSVSVGVEGLYYSFDDTLGFSAKDDFTAIRARLTMHLDRDRSGYGSAPMANWTGFYLGGHLGGLLEAGDGSIDSVDFAAGDAGSDGGAGTGTDGAGGGGGGGAGGSAVARLEDDLMFLGGVHIGFNWQAGNWVYGIEGDGSFGDDDKHSYLASARARLGYASGNTMIYATAGVAFAGIDRFTGIFATDGADGADGADSPDAGGTGLGGAGGDGGTAGATRSESDEVGFVIGAGIDTKLNDRITLGFEGLYYNFDVDSATDGIPVGATEFIADDSGDVFVLRSRLTFQLSPMFEPMR